MKANEILARLKLVWATIYDFGYEVVITVVGCVLMFITALPFVLDCIFVPLYFLIWILTGNALMFPLTDLYVDKIMGWQENFERTIQNAKRSKKANGKT